MSKVTFQLKLLLLPAGIKLGPLPEGHDFWYFIPSGPLL